MATYGDPFTTVLPPVGSAGPQYATDIDSILTDIMARLAAKVPLSSVLVTADLNLGGFSAVNANSVQFANQTTVPGATPSARLGVANGNLYYTGLSGVIQLTTGGQINASGIGGITGDYGGANPAQERYDVGNSRYDFFVNPTTNTWAYLRGLGFDFAGSSTGTARARLDWTGTVNQSYHLPAIAPASQVLMQMDATGLMVASDSLPINTSLTVSGTGRIIRGTRAVTLNVWASQSVNQSGAGATIITGHAGAQQTGSSANWFPLNFSDTEQSVSTINSVVLNNSATGSGITWNLALADSTGTFSFITGASSTLTTANVTLTPATPFILANQTLWVNCSSTATVNFYGATINTTVV